MAVTILTLAQGDTNYITKHNTNYDNIKVAIEALQAAIGGGTDPGASLPLAYDALFGDDIAILGTDSYLPAQQSAHNLRVAAGFVFLSALDVVVTKSSYTDLSFSGQTTGTYYIHVDEFGTPSFDQVSTDTFYSVYYDSGTGDFSSITRVANLCWTQPDWEDAQTDYWSRTVDRLADRLLSSEKASLNILEKTVTSSNITLTEAEAFEQTLVKLNDGPQTASVELVVPNKVRVYHVLNDCSSSYHVTVKTSSGTGYDVTGQHWAIVYCDATDCEAVFDLDRSLGSTPPSSFLALSDTPNDYSGYDGYLMRVNATPDGIEFLDPATYLLVADIDDTPVDAETAAPISSNWAYDHENAADPHSGYLLKTDIDDTPVDAETAAPISSNWAYDHENASDPHPGYLTQAEADALYEPDLGDPASDNYLLKSSAAGVRSWVDPATVGTTTLLGLSDTPSSYSGKSGQALIVNGTETGTEFGEVAASGGGGGGESYSDWSLVSIFNLAGLASQAIAVPDSCQDLKVVLSGVTYSSTGTNLINQILVSDDDEATYESSGYSWTMHSIKDSSASDTIQNSASTSYVPLTDWAGSTYRLSPTYGEAVICDPLNDGNVKTCAVRGTVFQDTSGDFVSKTGGGQLSATTNALTHVKIAVSDGTWVEGRMLVYQRKSSIQASLNWSVPFRGCFVYDNTPPSGLDLTSNQTLEFDSEVYDTDGFHSTSVNPSRITIPTGSGITKGQAWGRFNVEDTPAGDMRGAYILHKDSGGTGKGTYRVDLLSDLAGAGTIITTPVVSVAEGDYFELQAFGEDTSATLSNVQFAFEVKEIATDAPLTVLYEKEYLISNQSELVIDLPDGYDSLFMELFDILPVTDDTYLNMQFSTDGGSTWKSSSGDNHVTHHVQIVGSSTVEGTSSTSTSLGLSYLTGNESTEGVQYGTVSLGGANDPSIRTSYHASVLSSSATAMLTIAKYSGMATYVDKVDAIRIFFTSGNLSSGKVKVRSLPIESKPTYKTDYTVAGFFPGTSTADATMLVHPFNEEVTFPVGLAGSYMYAETAATGSTDYDIQKNGSSVGTANFAASATTATFTFSTETVFSAGDKLQLIAPSTADSTLADISMTFKGTR